MDALYIYFCIAALWAAVLLLFLVVRRDRKAVESGKRDDLASMTFLLQTMRELLEQQKGLARELNQALEARVQFIKQSVQSAREELAAVRDSIQELRTTIDQYQREAAALREHAPAPPKNITPIKEFVSSDPPREKEHERPVLRVLASASREPEQTGDVLDAWVGLDFGGDEPDTLGFDVPDIEPQAPHDPDAARSAFRALLDLEPQPASTTTVATAPFTIAASADPNGNGHAGGNGRPIPPIHARVYDYNDAGMSIAQIAQELGIGKGEVRLILSLRKARGT